VRARPLSDRRCSRHHRHSGPADRRLGPSRSKTDGVIEEGPAYLDMSLSCCALACVHRVEERVLCRRRELVLSEGAEAAERPSKAQFTQLQHFNSNGTHENISL